MKISSILGIDVSKKTLDCYLHVQQQGLPPVSNDIKGFKSYSTMAFENIKDHRWLNCCDGVHRNLHLWY